MKFSLAWLQEYIDPALTPEQIGDTLTHLGLEVDSIEQLTLPTTKKTETVFEVSLTPNLGHCANIVGIARELSAATNRPMHVPLVTVKEDASPIAKQVSVTVHDPKGCPRYACRLVKDIKVGPSPTWLQERLIACGLRPVNNVVDVTNLVVLELGQPLHAFDFDRLEGHQIIVRAAKAGERFQTLDDKERILSAGDILICDAVKPVALGGIMGGLNSEVNDKTTQVLLEAAYFHPGTIRKTSKRLGLMTDASKRFERGCDPNQVLKALDRAAVLIQELAGGHVGSGIIDVQQQPFVEKHIDCRLSRINRLLGTQLSVSEVENIFQRLGLSTRWDGQDTYTVTVPTYRVDITAEVDLIEEAARLYGYQNIPKVTARYHASTLVDVPIFRFEREVRARLIGEGLQEFLTCDLIGPTLSAIVKEGLMGEEAWVRVMNPTSIEQSILRTTMLPGLLQVVKYNFDHQNHNVSGFEIGRIHFRSGDQYKEQPVVGIVLSGKNTPHHWNQKPQPVDFYQLKGMVENLLTELNIPAFSFRKSAFPAFHSGRQASIFVGELEIGSIGELHPMVLRRLDVSQRILFAELSLQDLMQVRQGIQKMMPLPIYPASERDWTLTAKEGTSIEELVDAIRRVPAPLLEEVSLLDVYRSEKLGAGLKNVTFHFIYRDKNKTIEQEAVDAEHARIIKEVTRLLANKINPS